MSGPRSELTLVEAAEYLGVTRQTIWKHAVARGLIPFRTDPKDRRRKLFKKSVLDRLERPRAWGPRKPRAL